MNVHTPAQFGAFIPWLVINRGPLGCFMHPNTGDEIRDLIAGKRPTRDLDDTPSTPRGSAVPSAGRGRKRGEPDAGLEPQPQA